MRTPVVAFLFLTALTINAHAADPPPVEVTTIQEETPGSGRGKAAFVLQDGEILRIRTPDLTAAGAKAAAVVVEQVTKKASLWSRLTPGQRTAIILPVALVAATAVVVGALAGTGHLGSAHAR